MKIASLETRHYRYPLEPPFVAAWDPEPRRFQDATVAIVRSDDGIEGYASGDALPDRELLQRLLVGLEVSDTDAVHGIVETVDFHHGRNWIAEVAVWDLLGRNPERAALAPARRDARADARLRVERRVVTPEERARRCVALRDAGVRAAKLRLHSTDWRSDLPVLEAVRDAVGGELELMVDANQGWRMPGDLTPRWTLVTATEFAKRARAARRLLARGASADGDLEGYAELSRTTDLRSPPARWCAPRPRPATSSSAAECTSSSPTSSSPAASPARGRSPSSPPRASAGGARTRGRTATGSS